MTRWLRTPESDEGVHIYIKLLVDRYRAKREICEERQTSFQTELSYLHAIEQFCNLSKAPEKVKGAVEQIMQMKVTPCSVEVLDLEPFMDYDLGYFEEIIAPVEFRASFQSLTTSLKNFDVAAIENIYQENPAEILSCLDFVLEDVVFNYDDVARFYPFKNKINFNSVQLFSYLNHLENGIQILGRDFSIPPPLLAQSTFEMTLAEEMVHSVQHQISEKLFSDKASRMKVRKELFETANALATEDLSRLTGMKEDRITMLVVLLVRLNPVKTYFSDLADPRKKEFESYSKFVELQKLPGPLLEKVMSFNEIVKRGIPLFSVAEGYPEVVLDELAKTNSYINILRQVEQYQGQSRKLRNSGNDNYSIAKHSVNLFASAVNRELGNDAYRIVFRNPPDLQELKDPKSYLKRVG